MTPTDNFDAIEYLIAKKPIDDRALNRHVWDSLWNQLPGPPLRILELGAGIGTMLERLLERGKLSQAEYIGLDLNADLLEAGRNRMRSFGESNGLTVHEQGGGLALQDDRLKLMIQFHQADVTGDIRQQVGADWDLLIGNALLDLVHIPTTLPNLMRLIQPDGMFYFTITFDGLTHFAPVIEPELDQSILNHYHQTMDERRYHGRAAGHSQSGRILLAELQQLGAHIVAAGSSDWVVHPQDGAYTENERRFLTFILDTVEGALLDREGLDPADLQRWLAQRRNQLAAGELMYLAHQLDVCGFPPVWTDQP